jgi:hypothetical protein
VRLTLRTLLAYLDDTLEPAQAKLIGQKVAESDAAQELVARIKQVTRRRRLTTPPVGPGAKTDPNTVAEYLDNVLPGEQLAEVEETCLASDVHLAEIAACHQILTLVLGEPALVPPMSRQRMYRLVKGPEAIPYRKVPRAGETTPDGAEEEGQEVDETLRMGIPAYRSRGSWTQPLALIAGGLALVGLLAVAIWQSLLPDDRSTRRVDNQPLPEHRPSDKDRRGKRRGDKDKGRVRADRSTTDGKRDDRSSPDRAGRDGTAQDRDRKGTDRGTKDRVTNRDKLATDGARKGKGNGRRPPVQGEAREVGRYLPPTGEDPSILLRRGTGEEKWQRLKARQREVATTDTLVSLPGYRSEVRFDSGLSLHLLGDLPELSQVDPAAPTLPVVESAVVVHEPGDFDVDLTLDHGRILLTSDKEQPAKVRIRFANPTSNTGTDAWEITLLKKDSSVGLELWGRYPPEVPFTLDRKKHVGPQTELYLFVLKGQVHVKIEDTTHGMAQPEGAKQTDDESARPSLIIWNSRLGVSEPKRIKSLPMWALHRYPPIPANFPTKARTEIEVTRLQMINALKELSGSMTGDQVEVALLAALRSDNRFKRVVAVRCFGALDDLANLMDGLIDENSLVRESAVEVLRHWIALHADHEWKLHTFLISKKGFSRGEATSVLELLHSYSDRQRAQPATYARLIDYLRQDNAAIRVLAHWHLVRMVPWGFNIRYDPLGDSDVIERGADTWKKLIPEGSLPKPPPKKSTRS